MITLSLEGIDGLLSFAGACAEELKVELKYAVIHAAEDGVDEAKRNHPYTDRTRQLTSTSSGESVSGAGESQMSAEMVFPMAYASYVDAGTSRSRPYPFTPQAMRVGEASLIRRAQSAADRFADKINSK